MCLLFRNSFIFVAIFILSPILTNVKTYGLDGKFNLLNIVQSTNVEQNFRIHKEKIIFSTRKIALLERSKDLNLWYGVKTGKRFMRKLTPKKHSTELVN